MTDEEYLFKQTEIERKKLGYGDKHKKRGGGRVVRLPSDNLTRKEWESMNGEVFCYNPRRFYSWEEFKALPMQYQVKYVNTLLGRYDCGLSTIGEIVFGLSSAALRKYFRTAGEIDNLNYDKSAGGATSKDGMKRIKLGRQRLFADVAKARGEAVEEIAEEAVEETQEVEAPTESPTVPEAPATPPDAGNLAALLQLLIGTGAKLTIEVTL